MRPSGDTIIDTAIAVWFALTALSVIYVAWDAFRNTPEMPVMKWGWVLVTFYTGPVGGALYVLSCQEPAAGTHEDFVRPLWKQALGSTIHCLAGDATGVIAAATVTVALGYPMWFDVTAEYAFGFAFGLLIFQALFMREMLGGSYITAVKRSLFPEWLSMNAVMAGMVPVMVILMSRDMRAMEPSSLRYWATMSLATIVGFAFAFPVNVWLVATGLKHGMGTVRVLGKGGHGLRAEAQLIENISGEKPATTSATDAAGAHASHNMLAPPAGAAEPEPEAMNMKNMENTSAAAGSGHAAAMAPPSVTRIQLGAVTLLTLLQLGAGILIAALYGDFTMRSGTHQMPMPASQMTAPDHTMPR